MKNINRTKGKSKYSLERPEDYLFLFGYFVDRQVMAAEKKMRLVTRLRYWLVEAMNVTDGERENSVTLDRQIRSYSPFFTFCYYFYLLAIYQIRRSGRHNLFARFNISGYYQVVTSYNNSLITDFTQFYFLCRRIIYKYDLAIQVIIKHYSGQSTLIPSFTTSFSILTITRQEKPTDTLYFFKSNSGSSM